MRKSLAIAIGLAALVPTVSKAQERAYVYSGAACVYQLQFRTVPDTGDTLGFTGAGGARQGGAVRGIVQGGAPGGGRARRRRERSLGVAVRTDAAAAPGRAERRLPNRAERCGGSRPAESTPWARSRRSSPRSSPRNA